MGTALSNKKSPSFNYYEMNDQNMNPNENITLDINTTIGAHECNPVSADDLDLLNSTVFGLSLAVPEFEAFVTVAVLSIIIVLTIIGNILVILSVFTYKPLRIVQNFFIVSLAVADLTVAMLVLPFNVAYSILGRWEFGITMCKLWLTCDVMCCTSSILNLCVIALDRYWAITDPINYAHKRTVNRVLLLIAGVWVLSLLISSPPLVGWNDWPSEFTSATPCELNSDRGYVIYSSLGSFFIPLIVMTIVYVEIYIATRRRLRERAQASKINTMALRGSRQAVEDSAKLHSHSQGKRKWSQMIICCFHKSEMKLEVPAEDVESMSSDGNANNQAQLQRAPTRLKRDDKGDRLSIANTDLDQSSEVERSEALGRKKGRRPRIKDSIKQARKQMPQRRCKSSADESSVTKETKNKNSITQQTKDAKKKEAGVKKATRIEAVAGDQVCIEVCVEGEEGTSACDNDDENASMKITPPQSSGGLVSSMSVPLQKKNTGGLYQIIEERQKISLSKERRAARTLGIIMGIFVICWLPFSLMYVILPFCDTCCPTNKFKNFITWLGYINSGLNPVIYTIFNLDYRRAFKRLLGIK